jgi:adenine-specific DNA-methyltransferase
MTSLARMAKTIMPVSAFEDACDKISKLAATFQANEARYFSPNYQEAEARKDFIDKFFIALGWDVNHDEQTNPYEQEVKVEPPVSAGGQRRADYAFHLAPNYRDVRFFVEAKKPHGDIATADNYFQTIRYGWNTETPLAVLTDFKQFHVLDCRYKPDIATALHRHVATYHYSEYSDRKKFGEIYWLFSHEAVADGSLEKRAKDLPKPRGKAVQHGLFPGGYQSIDDYFLKELDEYRTALARTFKNKNPSLDSETLTELVQRTLDRLVFLRFLEDKGIEPQRVVDRFGDKGTAWEDFIAASRRLDGIYNGVVFKYHTLLDGDKFRVDENPFADICESLAHVNSPYDFDAIPIHILGSIYERFLGNVIVATDKRVHVEPKPDVRKAGGVYYTPEYIVRYIVENTIGKLIADKTPDQIAEMRFADIACGSGSFLLGVFDLLLTYHGQYYNDNPKKARKGDCIDHDGRLYLSLRRKREILLNNIYGVDIDAQAVEVCQLSLYLRLLKEETTGSTHQYLLEFAHTAQMKKLLPDLSKNIVCGNSLVGTDILDGQLFEGEGRKLNPMDFEDKFPEVMERGGFDAIVGNPPYITYALGKGRLKHENHEIDYISEHYPASSEYKMNSFAIFYERGLSLCRKKGLCAYIVPGTILINQALSRIRQYLLRDGRVRRAVQLNYRVFRAAEMGDCAILFVEKDKTQSYPVELHRYNSEKWDSEYAHESAPSEAILALSEARIYMRPFVYEFLKIAERGGMQPLGSAAHFYNGIKTGDNKRFLSARKESSRYVPVVRGRDFDR